MLFPSPMLVNFGYRRNFGVFLIALVASSLCFAQMNDGSAPKAAAADTAAGKTTFNASCTECHGLDGRGTDKAIDIAGNVSIRSLTDAQLTSIISEGVVEEGMPSFRSLSPTQLRDLVAYVRTLQGKGAATVLPGNPKHGREIFFGKGGCANCHSVAGQGGFMGPDLTNHAATSSADAMRTEIIRSPRVPPYGYRMAVLTTSGGDRVEGVVRNEDNFSVQLLTIDGNFHLFKKSDLKKLEYSSSFLMPTDYRARLSDSDLNDLVSYLLTTPDSKATVRQKKWEEDEE